MGRMVTKPFHSDDVTKKGPSAPYALPLKKKSRGVGSRGWVTQGDVTQGDVTQSRKGWRW